MLACRIFLGIFEAAIVPSLILSLSRWYAGSEGISRLALCYCGLPVGQILGSLSSFGFQHVTTLGFESWRIMFVSFGGVTVLVGVATFIRTSDDPSTARFLSEKERDSVARHVSPHTTGEDDTIFNRKHASNTFKNEQLMLFIPIVTLVRVYKVTISLISLTPITARPCLCRYQHFFEHADRRLRILSQRRRATEHCFWCGLDGEYPHRWFRCTPHLEPVAVVHCHVHSGCDWWGTDELLTEEQ